MGRTPSVCTVATPSVRTIRHHTKVPGAFRNPSRSHKTPSVYTQQDQDHKAMRTCGLKSRGAGSNQAIVLKPKLGVRKRRLKTPSRGQQAKASVAGVDMPFLKKGRASQVTWSCPLCKYDAHGTTKAIYPQKRHHVQTRHPLEKYGNLIGKAQITVATPSADLPADARAWKCPLCPKAFPALPKRETHLAVSRHRREEHPEINTKDWKSAMVKVWARGVKKPKVARQSRTKADKLRKKLWPSHDLVEVYCQCPKASFHRNPTQFWCVGCMAKLAGYGGGSRPRDEKLTCHQVKKLAQAKQRVRRAWAIIKDLKTVDSKPLKHSWVRDLIEEGIEPNPGPDMLKCISLNTQGAPGAWHALQLMQEERIHVGLCRKSPCPQKKFSLSDFLPTKAGLDCIISWVMLILGQGGAEPSLYKNFYMRNFWKHGLNMTAKPLRSTWRGSISYPTMWQFQVRHQTLLRRSSCGFKKALDRSLGSSWGTGTRSLMNVVCPRFWSKKVPNYSQSKTHAVACYLPAGWVAGKLIWHYQPKICGSGASVHGSDHWWP